MYSVPGILRHLRRSMSFYVGNTLAPSLEQVFCWLLLDWYYSRQALVFKYTFPAPSQAYWLKLSHGPEVCILSLSKLLILDMFGNSLLHTMNLSFVYVFEGNKTVKPFKWYYSSFKWLELMRLISPDYWGWVSLKIPWNYNPRVSAQDFNVSRTFQGRGKRVDFAQTCILTQLHCWEIWDLDQHVI